MWSFNTIVMNCIRRRIAFFTVLLIFSLPGSYLLGYVHNHFSLFGPNEALIEEYYRDYWEVWHNINIANLLDIEDTGVRKRYTYLGMRLSWILEIFTTLDSRFDHAELAASKPRRCAQVRKIVSFYHQYYTPGSTITTKITTINRSITIHIGIILPDLEQYLQEHCLDPFFDSAGEESK